MSSLVNYRDAGHARTLLWLFALTYTLDGGRFVNKIGQEAPQRTLDLVAGAQAMLADES